MKLNRIWMAANNKQYVAINNYCESANLIVIRQNWIFSIVESVISGKYVFECSQCVTFIVANIFIICFANMHNGMKRIKNFCFNCEINYCYYSFFCGRTLSISINNFCCDKSEQKKFIKNALLKTLLTSAANEPTTWSSQPIWDFLWCFTFSSCKAI